MASEARFVRIAGEFKEHSPFVRVEKSKYGGTYISVCEDGLQASTIRVSDGQLGDLYKALDLYLREPSGELFLDIESDNKDAG